MGWKSWFGTKTEQNPPAEAGWKLIADTVMHPLNTLTWDICATSWECSQKIQPYFRPNGSKHPENQIVYIDFTFIAFFMRVLAFLAFWSGVDRDAFLRLKDALLTMLVPATITMFFGDPPDRSQLEAVWRKTLEDAENLLDNQSAQNLSDAMKRITFDAIRDILVFAGYKIGPDRNKAESAAIEETCAECFREIIVTPERLANYTELLRHGVAAIESCRKQGLSIPAMMKDAAAASRQVSA